MIWSIARDPKIPLADYPQINPIMDINCPMVKWAGFVQYAVETWRRQRLIALVMLIATLLG
jgi:hypothetical protein